MNLTPRYFVRLGEEVRGPYDVTQLGQLAEVEVVSRATAASESVDGPWLTLGDHPGSSAIFPARRVFVLKPTITRAEQDRSLPPVDLQAFSAAAQILGRGLRPFDATANPLLPTPKVAGPLNEVEAMVRDVRDREAQFAPPPPPPPKRRMQRRTKLVAVLALAGNGILLAIPTVYGAWDDDWSMLIFRGWWVIFNLGLVCGYFALPKE